MGGRLRIWVAMKGLWVPNSDYVPPLHLFSSCSPAAWGLPAAHYAAEMWRNLPADDKASYLERSAEDK